MDVATSLAGLRLMKPFSTRFQQGTEGMNSDHGAFCRLIPSDYDQLEGALDAVKRIPCTDVIVIETDNEACVPGLSWGDVPVAEVSAMPPVRAATQRW